MDEAFGLLPNSKQRITCLPYTRSPFTLPDTARTLSFEQSKIDNTLKVEPDSIRFPLVSKSLIHFSPSVPSADYIPLWFKSPAVIHGHASQIAPAYPVLFPVYIMQWEGFDTPLGGKPNTFNMILDAHEHHVRPFFLSLAPC